jgi:hypothetical protein
MILWPPYWWIYQRLLIVCLTYGPLFRCNMIHDIPSSRAGNSFTMSHSATCGSSWPYMDFNFLCDVSWVVWHPYPERIADIKGWKWCSKKEESCSKIVRSKILKLLEEHLLNDSLFCLADNFCSWIKSYSFRIRVSNNPFKNYRRLEEGPGR